MDICIGRMSLAVVKTLVCLQIFLGLTDAGQYCNYYISYGIYSYRYCSTSCCGTVYSSYCCLEEYTTNGGVIAGGVVGGLVLLACFIVFVIYTKKYSTRGVVRPHNPVISVSSTSGKGMTIVRPAAQNVQYSYGQVQPQAQPYSQPPQPYSQPPPPTYPPPPPQSGASAPYPPPAYIGSHPPSYTGPPAPLC